jgi:hypothetical protein
MMLCCLMPCLCIGSSLDLGLFLGVACNHDWRFQAPLYSIYNKHFLKCISKFTLPIENIFCSSIRMVIGQVAMTSTIYNLFQFFYKMKFCAGSQGGHPM